ncbi:glycoside hydrolase family 15 protein [Xylona heveae TC161]|uniref:Glycoside hydrolase family 15 protein n=1 Tax=Xylona heveae (strain CBS 132557 / TC161) TaxID=1328760 RepID=A0A165GPJ4_XYLHT|nr:glycoside hydrolase family 15 protein [Xylona heveae TC161]KZF22437.1 glycoside hydrolase family 15 protein [Xylona heveae TC161]
MEDHTPNKYDATGLRGPMGYMPIENYGLIGNLRTCALVAVDGSIDHMCWPEFDSPSIFCRLIDKDKGGHFMISPEPGLNPTTKQEYLPNSNVLQTRWIHEAGCVNLTDYFPRPRSASRPTPLTGKSLFESLSLKSELKRWLVRRVECIRGELNVNVELFPAFNYAQDEHITELVDGEKGDPQRGPTVLLKSRLGRMRLDCTIDGGEHDDSLRPVVKFKLEKREGFLGKGVVAKVLLHEGQTVSFVFREDEPEVALESLSQKQLDRVQQDTQSYWHHWIAKSKYKGRCREIVNRSLMVLKLLTYEPTGAIIAAPTFSLPEDFGGTRNWDYRYCWVRDSSFTIYALLRMGFTEEAEAYMTFLSDRLRYSRAPDGGLPIMFSIRGDTQLEEIELCHLDGYRGSKPVRIGNGAAFHKQLDIYGEMMDSIYLYNKYGKPVSWDQWVAVREITDYIAGIWREPDNSIWEVRGQLENFVYSKIMLWVAFDRALRLADKRSFPCPHRFEWLAIRDEIYEDIMKHGFNKDMNCLIQSYESNEVLDSAVLIAPLVFFMAPNDPRFLGTIDQILKPPEKGGLTSAGLVYRYNHLLSNDGVGGAEGAFSMCTFWLVEALTRAGAYDRQYLVKAESLFESMLSFSNHLSMYSEEIAKSGEQLGNTPQAFSHIALISAAFNLDRTTGG